jgi:6,7-dimethyl-8-ribityllumazine synthase
MQLLQAHYQAPTGRIALVAARFNEFIVDPLVRGAEDCLLRHGVAADALTLVRVPGAYELAFACDQLAASGRYQGIVALGCVIRGATAHFEQVAGAAGNPLLQLSLKHAVPLTVGVLTVESIEQAIERAGTKAGNKGAEAAMALIEMMNLQSLIKAGA